MFWFIIELILLFLWQLPQNLIAIIMLPFLGKMKLVRFNLYCWAFECKNIKGSISLGNFIFLYNNGAKKEATIYHEYGHVMQSHKLGWLYLLIIGLPSILNAWIGFTECYYDFYTEKWANKLANLKTGINQYGCFLYIEKEKNK